MKLLSFLVAVVVSAAGCVPSVFLPTGSMVTPEPFVTPAPTMTPTATPEITPTAEFATPVRAYLMLTLADGTTGLVPVRRDLFMLMDPPAAETMRALLDGPDAVERASDPAPFTQIPVGTRLVTLDMSGPVANVELSREFLGGSPKAVLERMAQVVYTLTQFPTVTSVAISVERVAVTAPFTGGALKRPLKRTDFSEQLPAICVDTPAWGDLTTSPITVRGYANVFEAQFMVQIRDGAGTVLSAKTVTASCGTGCWGTFLTTLPYSVAIDQWGTLRVYSASAKDGAPENERIYPIRLRPQTP